MLSKIAAWVIFLVFVVAATIIGSLAVHNHNLERKLATSEKVVAELKAKIDYANEKERLKEFEFNQRIGKLKDDIRRKNNKLESERASADTATDSLLKHLADIKSRIPKQSGDTARATATRTGEVLGECATRYRDVAAEAQRLAGKVTGLQVVAEACLK
jgi:hypothetical protein